MFQTIRDLVGAKVEPIYADPRAGDGRDSSADIQKAQGLLGYRPLVSFDEGLKKTVEWYRSAQATIACSGQTSTLRATRSRCTCVNDHRFAFTVKKP